MEPKLPAWIAPVVRLLGFISCASKPSGDRQAALPSAVPGIRSTQKYWAASLDGAWARSPYLRNGSVRTMKELPAPPAERATSFHRGSRVYDAAQMGYTDAGAHVLDTSAPGNSNAGHEYGTGLSADQKRDLIEFLKTL